MRYFFLTLATCVLVVAPAIAQRPSIVREVRGAINADNYASAEQLLKTYAQGSGKDSAYLEALSWLGRGKLAAKKYDEAGRYAEQTRTAALELLKKRKLDDDSSLPLALGASIEVQSQVMNARGQKSEAVAFLKQELQRWNASSIHARISKNLNMITLEGKAPLALDVKEWIGAKPPALASLKGKRVLLFFWAHWCGDCKWQSPILARLKRELGDKLVVVAPTQPYGYVAGGEDAPRHGEVKYIESVLKQSYAGIGGITVPVGEENFKRWGVSTTPTIAVVDEAGVVRLYHPGRMTYEELLPYVRGTGAAR